MSAWVALAGAALGGAVGAALPRAAYRLSVEFGTPPRGACPGCDTAFPAGAAGWVRLGARCPTCSGRVGPPAWVTAGAGAVVAGALGWAMDPTRATGPGGTIGHPAAGWLTLAAFAVVGLVGVLLAAVDLACLRLPDVLVGPAFGAALVLLTAAAAVSGRWSDLGRGLAAAALLTAAYLLLALLPGAQLGLGDVKLCLPLGLVLGWLSWGAVLLGAVLPHLINAPVVLLLLATRRVDRRTALPLGPALLAGALLAVILPAAWGP